MRIVKMLKHKKITNRKKFIWLLGFLVPSLIFTSDYYTDEPKDIMVPNNEYSQVYLFQKRHKEYLIFYSRKGKIIYIRFQKDLFDYQNLHYLKILKSGIPYQIIYRFVQSTNALPVSDPDFIEVKSTEKQIRKPVKIYEGSLIKIDYYIDHTIRY